MPNLDPFQSRGVDDGLDALHCPAQPVAVAHVANEPAQPFILAIFISHRCLGVLATREDANPLSAKGKSPWHERPAKATRTTRD